MKRSLVFALLTTMLAGGACLAQTDKASKDSKAAMRQEMVPAPLRSTSASAVRRILTVEFPGVRYPQIEADSGSRSISTPPTRRKCRSHLSLLGRIRSSPFPFDMVKGDDGVWTYTSGPQGPGYHNYWMLVDGTTVLDTGTSIIHRLQPHVQWL